MDDNFIGKRNPFVPVALESVSVDISRMVKFCKVHKIVRSVVVQFYLFKTYWLDDKNCASVMFLQITKMQKRRKLIRCLHLKFMGLMSPRGQLKKFQKPDNLLYKNFDSKFLYLWDVQMQILVKSRIKPSTRRDLPKIRSKFRDIKHNLKLYGNLFILPQNIKNPSLGFRD